MIEIKRDAYLQQLTMQKDNGMIKVITGIRRCGKSFLLFNIFKRYLQENGVAADHIIACFFLFVPSSLQIHPDGS